MFNSWGTRLSYNSASLFWRYIAVMNYCVYFRGCLVLS
nr:MAG TPA: hypothetical protein [Bacteriophage sp.]